MKLPLSWLREYVDFDLPPKELAHQLTMAGTEVESVLEIGADWQGVVVVKVIDLDRHPNADNLLIAKVDTGDRTSTIVTGAPNLSVGIKVPLVMPGGKLPDGIEITRRKFRGIESEGMLCAGDELGLSPDHDGIYILEEDAPIGEELRHVLGEVVLDLYITPNRADCMSVIGIAREVQALTGNVMRQLRWLPPKGDIPATDLCRIEVADTDLAPRYTAAVIRDLQIRPSPPWLQRRLFLAGVRPISNVVDITNYVMLTTGQPMHAFDGGKLQGGIVVRRAQSGERITTLDGQDRVLGPEMLLIADHERPIGIAGVMGGADSEIGPETKLVVLESANFNQVSVRRTSRDLALKTEAARRFERGLDPGLTLPSAARATQLMLELANGRPADGVIDVYPRPEQPRRVTLRLDDVARLLGRSYEQHDVVRVLQSLEFEVEADRDALRVMIPGHRRDVERKADLIEEVARVTGYEALPEAMFQGRIPEPRADRERLLEERAKQALVGAGCQEVITYSLVHPSQAARLDLHGTWPPKNGLEDSVRVANPMSVDHSALRQTLLGSLLETLAANLRHRERVWCFELARVYLPPLEPLPSEPRRLALALAGQRQSRSWAAAAEPTDFFDLKGVIEQLLDALRVHGVVHRPVEHPTLQPGRAAELIIGPLGSARSLGIMGQVHPGVANRFELESRDILVAELDFDALCELASETVASTTLPRFPGLRIDLALVVDERVSQERVSQELQQAAGELLADVQLFDVYRGAPIPEGQKSLAYSLTFRAPDRTLTDEDVSAAVESIELRLAERLSARVRRG